MIRPLRYLENQGLIELSIVNCDSKGSINIENLINCFKPNTKLVATIHGSNVTGTLQPIRQIGNICKNNNVLYLIDAAQSAGFANIDMQQDNIDILAFTSHKKLYGPPGIGGLCINNDIAIETLIHGGTGSKSEMEIHPEFYPDRLEAGTGNTVGVVGLKAGIQFILDKGIDKLRIKQTELTNYFIKQLQEINEVILYGINSDEDRLPIVSMNIKNIIPSDLAYKLDNEFEIMVRAGLHCSPLAHKTIGTFPQGTVRFSIGSFNTEEEINYTIEAIKRIIFNRKER